MADRFEQARQIVARYWQGIGTAITSIVAVVVLFNDPSKWPIAIGAALAVIVFLRFPWISVGLTRWILGPPPAIENPPRIFRGPLPYVAGESLPARKAEVDQCWLLLQQSPFFTLEGQSGCGKSSLLASALLPRAREIFKVIECRIERDPLGRLAATLRGEPYRRSEETTPAELLAAIVEAGVPSKEEAERKPLKPLLLCFDQFEELFVTARDEKRRGLMTVLRELIEAGELRVLIAIRSDFRDLLLGLCREVDPSGTSLDLGSYFHLKAFSEMQARSALGEMLAPLHDGDPLKRQPLEEFSAYLVEELLRPPRDRRLSREDEKTVLPVELQMVGLMLEAVGVEVFSTDAYRRRGGKAGLLREYIEDAKDFVWRRTGISGDQALLIIRKLISPARTKWSQTAASIGTDLGLRTEEVQLVLGAFAERFLVKPLPADEAGEIRYELMHEHLVQVLVEAPQPVLQKARDAEERLRFWEERAEATFALTAEKGWIRRFVQPIPLLEALRLRRFATSPSAQAILKRNLRAFGAKLGVVLLPLVLALGGWELWRHSDAYQIEQAIAAAASSVDALADKDQQEDVAAVANWAGTLFLAGKPDEAESVWQKMKDASARSNSQASVVLYLVRSQRLDEALLLASRLLSEKEFVWGDAWEDSVSALVEAAAEASRHESIISTLKVVDTPKGLRYLGIAAEALARVGKTREAGELFGYANSAAFNLKAEQRAQALLDLAARARRSQLIADCIRFLQGAVVASRSAEDPVDALLASARAFGELGQIDQALSILREGILEIDSSWSGAWHGEIMQISIAAIKAGRSSDILLFAREDWKVSYASYVHESFLAALIYAGLRENILSELDRLEPSRRLVVISLAVTPLALEKREEELKRVLKEAREFLPRASLQIDSWVTTPLLVSAATVGDSVIVGYIINQEDREARIYRDRFVAYNFLLMLESREQRGTALNAAWSIENVTDRLIFASDIIIFSRGKPIDHLDNHLDRLLHQFRATSELPDDVLEKIALALVRGDREQAAFEVAAHVKAKDTLAAIAASLARSGRFDAALIITDKLKADRVLRSQTLASIIVEAASRGDDRSLSLLSEVEYPGDISRARSAIAMAQARSGEFSAARAMAETCSPVDKLAAFTDLVIEYALKRGKIPSRQVLASSQEDQPGQA